jgi:hypothetical protein
MFAIRARRKVFWIFIYHFNFIDIFTQLVSEKDMRDSIDKVIKGYAKFSATPKYMVYNRLVIME